jgi:antitoxin (DNA-binding transcriptional repressor) of toxin-antitoxin stability system
MDQPRRTVNVHEAKTIVVAKGGKPWARLVPMPEDELACLEQPLLWWLADDSTRVFVRPHPGEPGSSPGSLPLPLALGKPRDQAVAPWGAGAGWNMNIE